MINLKEWTTAPAAADGAWGTELLKAGLGQGEAPENWNTGNPEAVEGVARSYAEAGSRIILTNTFGGTCFKLAHAGLDGRMAELNRTGARLTARAGGGEYLTAGDMGPTGKMVFMGEVSEDEVTDAYARQAEALREGGADILVLETFTDLTEIRAALAGAVKGGGCPVICSMTYDRMADGSFRTVMGHSPEDTVPVLAADGAAAVGANCGAGVDLYVSLASVIGQLTDLPVWIKANAGLPVLEGSRVVYPMGPDEYASHIPALLDAGVSIIGGCCGTTPDHIRGIVRTLEDYRGRGI